MAPVTSSEPPVSVVSSEEEHVHNLVKHAAKASTCIEKGNTEYYECTICHKYFSDAAGEHEIEEGSWVLPLGDHTLEEHPAQAATCTAPGNSLYYSCSVCGKYFSDAAGEHEIEENSWVIPALEHDFNFDEAVIVEPTVAKEGTKTIKCSRCNEKIVYRLARLTALTLTDTLVKWDVVIDDSTDENEATSYKIYVDDILIEEVGPTVLAYDVGELATGDHKVEVKAIFTNENYVEYKGGVTNIEISTSGVSVTKKTDFIPEYDGAGNFSFIEKDGEQVLKLDANGGVNWDWNNFNVSTLYSGSIQFPAGKYRVIVDVMLGEKVDNQVFYYGSWGPADGWFPGYRYVIPLTECSTTAWTTIEAEYTIDTVKTGMPEISFGSLATGLTENSYLLVKNARFVKVDGVGEGETLTQYLNVFPREYAITGWGENGFVYNPNADNKVELKLVDNEYVLKLFTNASDMSFTIGCNSAAITTVGTYRVSIVVKLGPGATNVNNIGFRCFVPPTQTKPWDGDNVFDLSSLEGSTDYVTLTKNIVVTDNSNTEWMNLDFWVFTHNDEIQSIDNYVLVSGVSINKINVVTK